MSGLLSQAEEDEARAAIKLVTDTFMVTPIVYKMQVAVLDRFEEDRNGDFQTYNLSGLVEPVKKEIEEETEGSKDFADTMITFNLEDLQAQDLITPEFGLKFTAEQDYFISKGRTYRVTDAYTDGPLSAKDCLVIIKGKLSEKTF